MPLRLTGFGSNNQDEDFDRDERKFYQQNPAMSDKLKHWPQGKEVLQAGRCEHPETASSLAAMPGSAALDRGCDKREAWWCPTCKIGLVWHQVTYEETHDSRYGGCCEPVQPNARADLPPR